MLGVEPRIFHPVIPEIAGSSGKNLKDGHRMVDGWMV
jgi:hypothetical protein